MHAIVFRQPHLQSQVWYELEKISNAFQGKWLVIRDFNCILDENEKKGGIKTRLTKINRFKNCIPECGFIDIGFSGHPYTWTNRRYGKNFIVIVLIEP